MKLMHGAEDFVSEYSKTFKGEKGDSGVRVILLVNRRVGNELITTIDLNDGTSVASEPINIAQNAQDTLLEGVASGFIYAKIVEVG